MAWVPVRITGSSGLPAGAAVMTDAVSLFARVTLAESVSGQTDVPAFVLKASYAEANTLPTDAITGRFSGYLDTLARPSEAMSATANTWTTTATGTGTTAPTSPTNAQGQPDGAVATVKTGGVSGGNSILTCTIPRASIPNIGTYLLRAFYSAAVNVGDVITVAYAQTGGPSGSLATSGNFLTTPATATLTGLHPTNDLTVTFTHATSVPATGGQITVDAVGVQTTGAI